MKNIKRRHRGSTLVLVMIVVVFFSILGTAVLNISLAENKFAGHQEDKVKAYYNARAGAQSFAEQIIKGEISDEKVLGLVGMTSLPTPLNGGDFKITVLQPGGGSSKLRQIVSEGTFNGVSQTVRIQLEKTDAGVGLLNHAIYGKDGIGGGEINGLYITGPVGTNNDHLDFSIKDEKGSMQTPDLNLEYEFFDIKPPTFDSDKKNLTIDSDFNINVLNGATKNYEISSLDLKGNNRIIITGKGIVNLYINDADVTISGNTGFDIGSDVLLYIYINKQGVFNFNGSGEILGSIFIYGPQTIVNWTSANNVDIHGGIIAQEVNFMNHAKIVFDASMVGTFTGLDFSSVGVYIKGFTWLD